ncbi:MAG: FAD binding domain-containing protein [Spirochaetales bacterium]|nr:FAD binding domain-containing protein [Spirochaetales bacterium]
MILGQVELLRPETLEEAAAAFAEARAQGRDPQFYAGGTEILSLARRGRIHPDVLIDLKGIPQCRELGPEGGELVFGAALALNEIVEADHFPLLSAAAGRVADHTVRNRLSLGGNIAGRLPYRETVLALLVAEAEVELYGPAGLRRVSLLQVFARQLELVPGQFLVRVRVPAEAAHARWFHGRRERGTRVDYPLVTVCLLAGPTGPRLAVGGACGYPLRPDELESALRDPAGEPAALARGVVSGLRDRIKGDFRSSVEYRAFLLESLVREGLERLWQGPSAGTARGRAT